MANMPQTIDEAIREIEDLRARLQEAEEGIEAIRSGGVDAVIVMGAEGEQIYTLSGAERTYRILVEAMNEGALVLSPEGVVIYCNRTFAAMLGAPIYETLGHLIFEFVADADVEPLKCMLEHAPLRTDKREIELKHNDSTSIPAFISVGNLETDEGTSVSAVVTDLTEHKRTEAELEQYREHLEELVVERTKELGEAREESERHAAELAAFFSSMADGVVLFDAELGVLTINEAALQIIGSPADASIDTWAAREELFTLEGDPVPREQYPSIRALRGLETKDVRFRMVTPWKESLVGISGSPVLDAHGRVVGGTLTLRDVSRQVDMERYREELYQRERHITEVLQGTLIPQELPHELYGCSLAVKYQPALREAEVGGDFFDIFDLGNGRIGIIIGDVAGKGLRAAARVAEARYSVRSYSYNDLSPSRVLTLTNDILSRGQFDESSMLTAFFAIIDTASNTVTYANAGHEPPVVIGADCSWKELATTGMPLGVMGGISYSEETYELTPGDRVVMITDGIPEARADGVVLFEKLGVIEYLVENCTAPPPDMIGGLLAAATKHAGGSLQDDAALVVFECGCGD